MVQLSSTLYTALVVLPAVTIVPFTAFAGSWPSWSLPNVNLNASIHGTVGTYNPPQGGTIGENPWAPTNNTNNKNNRHAKSKNGGKNKHKIGGEDHPENIPVFVPEKRPGECALPSDPNIVPIHVDQQNYGWAMSHDQPCKHGQWCQYACKSGMYSPQWQPCTEDPNSGCSTMHGGLFCNQKGQLEAPFPDKPLCEEGMNNVYVENKLDVPVSVCQTVYPGNEDMLIPTVIQPGEMHVINVVPNTYWRGTSAQYYVNPADTTEADCKWGSDKAPYGNWGPFVFGAGQGKDGLTYISVAKNHLYSEVGFDYSNVYNVKIECNEGKCHGTEKCRCEKGLVPDFGDGVGAGCTVTVDHNSSAKFVIYQ